MLFDDISKFSARLSETVAEPSLWTSQIEHLTSITGSYGAIILQSDARTPDIPRTSSLEEGARKYLLEGWHKQDIRFDRGRRLILAGQPVVTDHDVMTEDDIKHSSFYQDLLVHVGCDWFAGICFRAGTAFWSISLQRDRNRGRYAGAELRLLASLSRRLTEVASLSTLVGRASLAGTLSALNRVSQPAITIDRYALVAEVNEAAESMFDDELRVYRRRLIIGDPSASSAVEALTIRLRSTREESPLLASPIYIRKRTGSPLLLRALPIDGPAKTPFLGARAILTFTPVSEARPPEDQMLRQHFGLTSAEARLAAHLRTGQSLSAAADLFSLSRETVRNQLKAIFEKTHTHRQAELVALLARFC